MTELPVKVRQLSALVLLSAVLLPLLRWAGFAVHAVATVLWVLLAAKCLRQWWRLFKRQEAAAAQARPEAIEPSLSERWISGELLPALDGLDGAIEHAQKSGAQDVMAPFVWGLKLVQRRFFKALEACEIAPIELQLGDVFDPEKHQAVDVLRRDDATPNTIAGVVRRGYRGSWGGREHLLRPAAVVVVVRAVKDLGIVEAEQGHDAVQ